MDADGKKHGSTWFAFDDNRPLAFFAGIMAPHWTSVRRVGQDAITTDLFAFLTTEPNAEIAAAQESMPVILRTAEEVEFWLTRPWPEVRLLQRPWPDGTLRIVSIGNKEDPPPPLASDVPTEPTLF